MTLSAKERSVLFTFFTEIGIIEQLVRSAMEMRLPDGMSQAHFIVLNHLTRVSDHRTPLELARAFQLPKTTMTHTLAGLEKRGLVTMRPNENDGRSKVVSLTDKGSRFRNDAIEMLAPLMQAVAEHVSLDILAEMVPRLADVRKVLDENRG